MVHLVQFITIIPGKRKKRRALATPSCGRTRGKKGKTALSYRKESSAWARRLGAKPGRGREKPVCLPQSSNFRDPELRGEEKKRKGGRTDLSYFHRNGGKTRRGREMASERGSRRIGYCAHEGGDTRKEEKEGRGRKISVAFHFRVTSGTRRKKKNGKKVGTSIFLLLVHPARRKKKEERGPLILYSLPPRAGQKKEKEKKGKTWSTSGSSRKEERKGRRVPND